jgi:exodeoxyribonuclease-3
VKIATYNVNGVNGRLDVLLQWLGEARPDAVVLQELKAPDNKFPVKQLEAAGYGSVWHGQKSWNGVAILARGKKPLLTRKGLPGDPEDDQSRYIEAVVDGIVLGGLYLPNGNPRPGPKFDYKLRWLSRLNAYAADLLELGVPVILAGDFNVIPTDLDVYKPDRWRDDALFHADVREAFERLIAQGWTDAIRTLHPNERIYTFWDYFRNAFGRDAGLRLDHFLLRADLADRLVRAKVDRHVRGWPHTSDHAPVWIELAKAAAASGRRASPENSREEGAVLKVARPSFQNQRVSPLQADR